MLMIPDKKTKILLDLASYLDDLDPSLFNMRNWCSCIAGHTIAREGIHSGGCSKELATQILHLSPKQASDLFGPPDPREAGNPDSMQVRECTPRQAASVVRHFALTGDINWSLADEKLVLA